MCPEELKSQIQLIFAKACADGLKDMAQQILDLRDPDREAAAKAYGEAFASAFVFVSRHFIAEPYSDRASQFEAPAALDGGLVSRKSGPRTMAEAVAATKRHS